MAVIAAIGVYLLVQIPLIPVFFGDIHGFLEACYGAWDRGRHWFDDDPYNDWWTELKLTLWPMVGLIPAGLAYLFVPQWVAMLGWST